MMSVLIRGMEMPTIPAFREKDNKVAFPAAVVLEKGKAPRLVVNYKIGYVDTNVKSYELVAVPTPHGDLIDRNEILAASNYLSLKCLSDEADVYQMITECPTIIEAEVSE